MRRRQLILVLVLLTELMRAQGGFRSRNSFPGASNNRAKAIFEIAPGSFFAAGFAPSFGGTPVNRLTIMKLDSGGSVLWYKQYGGPTFNYLNNQLISRSYYKQGDHIYYTGCVDDTSTRQIGALIKFDFNGDTIWQKLYRSTDPQEDVIPQMVTSSVDGGYLLTGFFQHWGDNTQKGLLIKTDSQGNELWRKKLSKAPPDVQDGKAVIQDSATKKIIVLGYQYPSGNDPYHNIVILDSLGNQLSQDKYAPGYPLDLIQAKDKSIYFCGYRREVDQQNVIYRAPFVAKFNLSDPSLPVWYKEFKPKSTSCSFSCIREVADGFVVCGWLDTNELHTGFRNDQIRFVTIDKNGNKLTDRMYDYKKNSLTQHNTLSANSFEFTSDGGWVCAIEVLNTQPNPFFFVKYDSTGCDSSEAYCQSLTADLPDPQFNRGFIFEMYPHPACDKVTVLFRGPLGTNYSVQISDVAGKTVFTQEVSGSSETIHLDGWKAGMYFVTLRVGNTPQCMKKLIVQQ